METTKEFIKCDCGDTDHIMGFELIPGWKGEPPSMYITVQMNPWHPWWKRPWFAIRYIFGKRSDTGYGHWECGNIGSEEAKKLLPLLAQCIASPDTCTLGVVSTSPASTGTGRTSFISRPDSSGGYQDGN